jgi:hypothetical protein
VSEVPRVTLVGVSIQVNPVEGDTDDVRDTVPVNALIEATVMMDVPWVPAAVVTLTGIGVTEKSGRATLYETVAEWDGVPLVPVTVTVKLPLVVAVQDRVELPEPVILVGVTAQVIPVVGDNVAVRLTTPPNPLAEATVIVDIPAWSTLTATLVGLAERVKSTAVRMTVDV